MNVCTANCLLHSLNRRSIVGIMPDLKFSLTTNHDTGEPRALVTIPDDPAKPVLIDSQATIEELRAAITQMGDVCRVIPKNNAVHQRLLSAIIGALPYLPMTQQDALHRSTIAAPAVYHAPITESQRLRNEADAIDKRDQLIQELHDVLRQCGVTNTAIRSFIPRR